VLAWDLIFGFHSCQMHFLSWCGVLLVVCVLVKVGAILWCLLRCGGVVCFVVGVVSFVGAPSGRGGLFYGAVP